MGNKLNSINSNVSDGVKKQAEGDTIVYQFIDVKGGGELVDLLKAAARSKKYTELDERIRDGFRPFLYNEGQGEFVHVSDLVHARRFGTLPNADRKKDQDIERAGSVKPTSDDGNFKSQGRGGAGVNW